MLVLLLAACSGPAGPPPEARLAVEKVTPGKAGARAGLEPGDLLLGWRLAAASPWRALDSPAGFRRAEAEAFARGASLLAVWRAGERREIRLPPDAWGIQVRPLLPEPLAPAAESDPEIQAWLWEERGEVLRRANRPAEAIGAYQTALRHLDRRDLRRALILIRRGLADFGRGRFTEVENPWREALEVYRAQAPGGFGEARLLFYLSQTASRTGGKEPAARLRRESLKRARRLDPNGPLVADILYEEALDAEQRGDLPRVERLYRETLARYERLGNRSLPMGSLHMGLGTLAWQRGHLEAAEREFRAALQIFEREVPDSVHLAWAFMGLGTLAHARGEWDRAEELFRRTLRLREKLCSGSQDHASVLVSLGALASERGDPEAARAEYRRALGIAQRLPDNLDLGYLMQNLGMLDLEAGNLEAAEPLFRRAQALFARLAPGSLDESDSLFNLADLASRRGRWDEAEALHRRILSVRRRLAPGTADEARSHHALGTALRHRGRLEEAVASYRRALAALEAQGLRLGGTAEAGSRFAILHGEIYKDLIDGLLALGHKEEAFEIHERYRLRGLASLLSGRTMDLESALPPDLARRRAELAREYDRTQEALGRLDATAPAAEAERLLGRLGDLREARAAVLREVREHAPHLADLESPQPLDLEAAARSLDPGTLLLAYSVGPEETVLFSVLDGGLETARLPAGAKDLAGRIESLRFLLQSPQAGRRSRNALAARSRDLYRLLIAPVEARVSASRRLLVLPDGPLHGLPFAALVAGGPAAGGVLPYLGQRRPVHLAASVTLYAEVRSRREALPPRLVAFGDPRAVIGGAGGIGGNGSRPAEAAPPLPSSRLEVEAITALFPGAAYLGSQATEERAKRLGRRIGYLHFACHGFADDRSPLDSYLALSPGGRRRGDNGVLQAWEIFEEMHLRAELVTLSACETGLGRELGGEGLTGLTRAFQYAGARTVLASLWSISDGSTAALMTRFYRHLRSGLSKDEALQAAQGELIRGEVPLPSAPPAALARLFAPLRRSSLVPPSPAREMPDLSHPYHWAAFQLNGDWR